VVVEMEEMETVAHDLTRLVVEGRPGTQARSRAGLDAFFSRPRCARCPRRAAEILVLGRHCVGPFGTAFFLKRNRPSLYQFQERSCCPSIPIGRYAAGYRGAIIKPPPPRALHATALHSLSQLCSLSYTRDREKAQSNTVHTLYTRNQKRREHLSRSR
jgi:hypothetical protein